MTIKVNYIERCTCTRSSREREAFREGLGATSGGRCFLTAGGVMEMERRVKFSKLAIRKVSELRACIMYHPNNQLCVETMSTSYQPANNIQQ